MNKNDIPGEFDWFAVDLHGQLALLATGGKGAIPDAVLNHRLCHEEISDSLESPRWGTEDVWSDYSEVGFYVFDWRTENSCYRKLRTPASEMCTPLKKRVLAIPDLLHLTLVFAKTERIGKSNLKK